ncbi:M23 family metallopeptidase [bacterium]|nr:M23 family metallopeptidase [bacterium]
MKRKGQKRFFSLMFVPDREGDPKSVTLSYGKGRWLAVGLAILAVHLVLGLAAYISLFQTHRTNTTLANENRELKSRNAIIESIYREFREIKVMEEKIKMAFGQTLGLDGKIQESLENKGSATVVNQPEPDGASSLSNVQQAAAARPAAVLLTPAREGIMRPENMPTQLPVDGFITARFRKGSWLIGRRHHGIDVAAPLGSPIRAAGSGTVLLADWTPDFGNMVILSHGNGYYSYYGHAMRLLVEQGTSVKKGQTIALLGSSGISSAPHLHFEIWQDNNPIDPEQVLFEIKAASK